MADESTSGSATDELSDEELAAQAAREGSDGVAFTALMTRFRERVWRVCWRLMGSQHDAADAAQEVMSLPMYPELTDAQVERICVGLRSLKG